MGEQMVTMAPEVLVKCMLENGSETQHLLQEGQSWRVGRGGGCDVTIKRHPYVSSIAFLIRYPATTSSRSGQPGLLTVRVMQRGAAKVRVEGESDERMFLSRGSYVSLRQGETYQIDLLAPVCVASVQLTTPPFVDGHVFAMEPSNTQTWSINGNSDMMPQWLDVAALACVIELFPDVRPHLPNGARASPSQTLQWATEVFVGRSSVAYYQQKLAEALQAANIEVLKGQDKQSRVASYFENFFSREKLRALRGKIREPIQILALDGDLK